MVDGSFLEWYSAIVSTLACGLILAEWSYVILWTRKVGSAIIGGVTNALTNLRPGRGKGRTAGERIADQASAPEPEEEAPAAPLALPGGIPTIGGIDPRALMEGKPILDKFMAGKKLTPEETAKGLQLIGYFSNAAKQWQGGGENGGGGATGGAPNASTWA